MPGIETSESTPRGHRVRRWLAIGTAAVLLLMVVALALLHTGPARRYVLDRVVELLEEQGINVQADDLGFNLLELSVNLDNVTVESDATPQDPFARIGRLDADLSLTDLIGGRYVVESMSIDDLDIHYIVYADGSDNVPRPPQNPDDPSAEPIDYLIEDGRITNADVHYDNREADLDVTLPLRTLEVEGNRATGRHAVTMNAGGGRLETNGRSIPLDSLVADIDLGRNDVDVESLVLESDDARIELAGTVEDFSSPVLDLQVQAALEAGRAAELAGLTDPVGGRVDVDASAVGPADALEIDATVQGQELAFRDLRNIALDLEAEYNLATGVARASRIDITAPWGALAGTATVATEGAETSSVDLTANDLNLGQVMRGLHVTPVAASRVDAAIDMRWPGLDYDAVSGDASLAFTPTAGRPAENILPIGGRLNVSADAGRVVANVNDLAIAGAQVDGRVLLTDLEQLGGTIRATIDDVGATVAAIEALTGRPPDSLLPADTSGAVMATASLGGTISAPTATVSLNAPAVSVANAGTVALDGRLRYTPAAVSIDTIDIVWDEARASATGRVGLAPGEPLSLTFRASQLEIPALLTVAGQDASLASGTLSLSGSAEGTFDQPRVTAAITGEGLSVRGEPLGTLTADVQLDDQEVALTQLALHKPQPGGDGRLTATGTYDLDTGAYTYALDSNNIELTSLTLPDGRPLRGQLALSGRGEGTRDEPAGTLRVSTDDLQVGAHALGGVTVTAVAQDGTADIDVTAPRFGLNAAAAIDITRPYSTTVDATISSLDLAVLPVELPAPLTGTFSASIDASGNLAEPESFDARAVIQILEGTWNGQPFALDEAAGVIVADEHLTIDGLTVVAQDSTLSVDGTLPLTEGGGIGGVSIDARLNLGTLMAYAPADVGVVATGTLTMTGTVSGTLARVDPDIEIQLQDASVDTPDLPEPLTGVALRAAIRDGVASVDQLTARWGPATMSATARVPLGLAPDLPVALPDEGGPATLSAQVSDLDPGMVPGTPEELTGRVSVNIDVEAEQASLASLSGSVTFDELDVALDTLTLAQQQPSVIRVDDGVATIAQLALSGSAGTIQAGGTVGLLDSRPLDVTVDGTLNVAAVSAFTEDLRADGQATVDITAGGTLGSPDLGGALTLADGVFVVDEPGIYAEDVSARVELSGRRITLADLSGSLNGGTLSGSGGFSLTDEGLSDMDVRLSAMDVAFEAPLDLRSLSDTTLTIAERDDVVVVSGRVSIQEAGLTADINFDTGLLATLDQPPALDLTEARNPLLERMRFDIEVLTETPIIVDNNLARAEITTDLRVLGTPYETGLSGRLVVLEGGRVTLNERDYAVEQGTITFLDERRIVPSMDLQLTTTAGRYDVTLGVTGEPGDTETTLTSTPTLPEPDIMALLVTGRTLDEMRGEEYEVAREQLLSYIAGRLGSTLGRDLEQATGLSEVRLEPNLIANETDPSARLTIGQDLTRALKLVFSTDLADSSDQIWVGRYDVSRRFDTAATRQSDGTYRLDLRHDVRFGGEQAPEQRPRVRPEVASLRVQTDDVLSEEEARNLLGVDVGDEYSYFAAFEGIRRIERTLIERDRLQSRVRLDRTTEGDAVALVLRIDAGPRVTVAFEGASPPSGVVEEVRRQWHRGVFDQQRAEDAMEALRIWFLDDEHLSPTLDYRIDDLGGDARQVVFELEAGQKFERVERVFDGAASVDPDVLDDIIEEQDLAQEVFIDPAVVTTLLERYYREEGFLVAEVDDPEYEFDGAVARVVIPVNEGPRFAVGEITIDGNTVISDETLIGELPLVSGDTYLPRVAAIALDRVRALYWDQAYNEVHSRYALALDRDSGRVDVTLNIDEGPRSVVAGVEIAGRDETSQRLVREQFELDPGDPLDLSLLAESRRNLYGTGAFSMVDVTRTPVETTDGAGAPADAGPDVQPVALAVSVREVQPFQVRYGVSFDTERGFGGLVDASNHNSLGKARVVGVRGRYDGQLREARAYFAQPSLLYFPVETTTSVYYGDERIPETAATQAYEIERLGASIQQERRLANSYVWTYGYRYERGRKFTVTDGVRHVETAVVSPVTSTFLRETRDELLDATTGSFTSHALSYSPSWLGADASYLRYYGQYFKYVPLEPPQRKRLTNEILRPRFVFATGVRLGLAWSPTTVPETERFYAGGSTTLRGFEQNAVGPVGEDGVPTGGQALLVLNNEVRAPLFSVLDGVAFLDIGNVFGRARDFSFSNLRETAGVGLRVRTPWFLLRGDYGFVLDVREGERRGQFYFSIGQAF